MELTREIIGQPTEKWVGAEATWVMQLHDLNSAWGWTENRFLPHTYYVRQGEVLWTMRYIQ